MLNGSCGMLAVNIMRIGWPSLGHGIIADSHGTQPVSEAVVVHLHRGPAPDPGEGRGAHPAAAAWHRGPRVQVIPGGWDVALARDYAPGAR